MSLAEIAQLIGGKVEGDGSIKVSEFATAPTTAKAGQIAIIFDAKLVKHIAACQASAVVVPDGIKTDLPKIVVKRPLLAMQKILAALQPKRYLPEAGVHPTAVVAADAELAEGVAVGPLVVIGPQTKIGRGTKIMAGTIIGGKAVIGENCLFHPGCLIADYVQIGNRVIMQQGASIGSDGYSYVTERPSNLERRVAGIKELDTEPNPHLKIANIGTVIIEDDVEVGSNATIDRATIGATIIGKGTKIDNLVMIAHNCRVGKEVLMVAQTGVAGSCNIGDRAILAGQSGIKDHINIGADVVLEAKTGVMKDIEAGQVYCGTPAFPMREFFEQVAHLRKAPQVFSEVRALQKKVAELEAMIKGQASAEGTTAKVAGVAEKVAR